MCPLPRFLHGIPRIKVGWYDSLPPDSGFNNNIHTSSSARTHLSHGELVSRNFRYTRNFQEYLRDLFHDIPVLFNMQSLYNQYKNSNNKEKTVSRLSYRYNGNPHTWKAITYKGLFNWTQNTREINNWTSSFVREWLSVRLHPAHFCDVIMSAIASQITSITIVYAKVYSCADQGKHQSYASLAFVCVCGGGGGGGVPVTDEFPAQMASNVENVSIWWRHHALLTWKLAPTTLIRTHQILV